MLSKAIMNSISRVAVGTRSMGTVGMKSFGVVSNVLEYVFLRTGL